MLKFAVVCEAPADFVIATQLADRQLQLCFEWLEYELLSFQRNWFDQAPNGAPLIWAGIKHLSQAAGINSVGFFSGSPAEPDAHTARRAIIYLRQAISDLAAIVLVRDQDDQPSRRNGLEQARSSEPADIPIVIGFAIIERESWVISGFNPQDQTEHERLQAVIQQLGHDPRTHSHRLTACKNDQALRSPKRVLRLLCGEDPQRDRERFCWQVTPLDTLRDRGTENGLVDYLDEIKTRLAPLIGHVPQD